VNEREERVFMLCESGNGGLEEGEERGTEGWRRCSEVVLG